LDIREILAFASLDVLEETADLIRHQYPVNILQPAETCLIMARAIESVAQSPFFLGEILITEAVVEVNNVQGYGFAMENQPERALCSAIILAALAAEIPEATRINEVLVGEAEVLHSKRLLEEQLVAATGVKFSSIEG